MGINIELTPQFEELVRQKVDSGLYASASEVVHEALRLMEQSDQRRATELERLRKEIREGLESGPADTYDLDDIKRQGRTKRSIWRIHSWLLDGEGSCTKESEYFA